MVHNGRRAGGSIRLKLLTGMLLVALPLSAQTKWYQFSKQFVRQHYDQDATAIGTLRVSEMHPSKKVHSIDCGGNDGELHIGVPASGLGARAAVSAPSGGSEAFGIVAEPPNVQPGGPFFRAVEGADGNAAAFYGYYRVWNEGHDVGAVYPSNPHHVLELHPIWAIRSGSFSYAPRPAVIFPMKGYSGYGASKFSSLLKTAPRWLRVAEDGDILYVQLVKADNFYQLPVVVKEGRTVGNGAAVAALVDVFSDTAHQNLVYTNLTVIAAVNSRIASQLRPNWSTYLLGFFSVNLRKAIEIAAGHQGISAAVPAPGALEFFAFGVPLQKAVSSSSPCTTEDD